MRIAIAEDGLLVELNVETPDKARSVGDVYLGRVQKVMPGIRAAFIDIGQPVDAFLHFSDFAENTSQFSEMIYDEEVDNGEDDSEEHVSENGPVAKKTPQQNGNQPSEKPRSHVPDNWIPDLIKDQEILVQVIKEPIAKKGSRVTTNLTLAGRFLVLMPFSKSIGVSKKIYNFKEKRRLKRIITEMIPEGFGVIIRTNAENVEEEALKKDIRMLLDKWKAIEDALKEAKGPTLVYKDATMISSVMRDLLNDQVDRVVVDDRKAFRQMKQYVKWAAPHLDEHVYYYKGREPIFDAVGIEKDVESAFSRKVWLKSGGYIIIEHTEAMVVIDVNSGRYAAKKEQEENSLKTNLEAARELCHQLRLRDIGGIIVVDFIDLQDEKNRKKIYDELKKEFKKDRAKTNLVPMTEFGLIQITRQRIRPSVLHTVSETCPMCSGTGLVQNKYNIINNIERWVRRFKNGSNERKIELRVHPSIDGILNLGSIFSYRWKWMFKYRIHIKVTSDPNIQVNDFKFMSIKRNMEITEEFVAVRDGDHEPHEHGEE